MLTEGHLNPKMLSAIVWTENACFEPSRVKFHARVTSVGESGEKNKNKKERPYISRISPGAPLRPIGTKFGFTCSSRGRNQLCKVLS